MCIEKVRDTLTSPHPSIVSQLHQAGHACLSTFVILTQSFLQAAQIKEEENKWNYDASWWKANFMYVAFIQE